MLINASIRQVTQNVVSLEELGLVADGICTGDVGAKVFEEELARPKTITCTSSRALLIIVPGSERILLDALNEDKVQLFSLSIVLLENWQQMLTTFSNLSSLSFAVSHSVDMLNANLAIFDGVCQMLCQLVF